MVGKYKVITLCGSTRFKDAFMETQKRLTLEGNIVISVGLFGHSGDEEVWTEGTKEMLDDMHKRKIDMADEIYVINVGGYIGYSTRSEIEYATAKGMPVRYLEEPGHKKAKKRNGAAGKTVQFYNNCVDDFHKYAKRLFGMAKKGVIFKPELIPIGEETILTFLQDPVLETKFGDDPQLYYYVIMCSALQAGMVYADKWRSGCHALNSEYDNAVIALDQADSCQSLLKKLGLSDTEGFLRIIYDRWLVMHAPYWEIRDSQEYTFKAMLAAYQLGVSMALGKKGH